MKHPLTTCALLLLIMVPAGPSPAPATAGAPRADDLAECLLRSTNDSDRALLVEWIFAMLSLHPAVQTVVALPDSTRANLNSAVAGLLERLLTVSCRAEARVALKTQGANAFEASFGILGQVAARDLFASPQVAAGMEDFTHYLDTEKLGAALAPTEQ